MVTDNKRPNIDSIQTKDNMSPEESFQNNTLRPIIKMKHDLFISYLNNYLNAKNNPLNGISREKQIDYLESVFQQDMNLKSELRGVILGQLTSDEFEQYSKMKSEVNKRMINIIKKRIVDHVDVFSN